MKEFFVSYAWRESKGIRVVDKLQEACGRRRNIHLLRDSTEVKYGESIRRFMQRGSSADRVIPVLSNAYFQSKWCAYELLLTALWDGGKNLMARIKPVVIDVPPPFTDDQLQTMVESLLDLFVNKRQVFAHHPRLKMIQDLEAFRVDVTTTLKMALDTIGDTPIPALEEFQAEDYSQILGPAGGFGGEPYTEKELAEQLSEILACIGSDKFTRALEQELDRHLTDCGLEKPGEDPDGDKRYGHFARRLVSAMRNGAGNCPVIDPVLSSAAALCLGEEEKFSGFQLSEERERMKLVDGVEQILGILLMSAVEETSLAEMGQDEGMKGLYFKFNLRFSGSIEVFLARTQHRKPDLELDDEQLSIKGKYLLFPNLSKFAWQDTELVRELQNQVWGFVKQHLMPSPGTPPGANKSTEKGFLTESDILMLKAHIEDARTARKQRYFAVVLDFADMTSEAEKKCREFLERVEIPIVRYRVHSDQKPFVQPENHLLAAATRLMIDLENYR